MTARLRSLRPTATLLLAACAAPGRGEVPPAPPARIALTITFEPALLQPGVLEVAHECGERLQLATGCAGVTVALLPGPALLTLYADGRQEQLAVRVAPDAAALPWPRAAAR